MRTIELRKSRSRDFQPARILIVDDDDANLVALRSVLAELGVPIVCARSGFEALRSVLKHDFAVILMDVRMPELDGYETAALIRDREKSRHIPIIFLSAVNKDSAHMFKGYTAGAVDYVFKPVEPLVLRSKVAVFIELHNKAREILRKAESERRLVSENMEVRKIQVETAEELDRSRMQQSLIIESLPIALYVASAADGFRSRRFFGGDVKALCGVPPARFERSRNLWLSKIHQDDRSLVLSALQRTTKTEWFSAEYRWLCADGSFRWFSDRGVVRQTKADGPKEMFGIWLDISERRTLEQQLVHSQKIEAIGQLTASIAHDFNNMLSVIIGSLERVGPVNGDDPKAGRRIELALQAAHTCSDLIRQLLGFARRQALEPRAIALDKQFDRLKQLLRRTLGASIEAEVLIRDDVWPVYLDPTQLETAVVNLAINARDAMPKGGTFTIRATNRPIDDPACLGLDIEPGDYVELSVIDTGAGMTEEVRRRAFEPFFTTKAADKGTGLGLSTIYGFVKQSGGTITVESEVGRGTVFRLMLPRSIHPAEDLLETDREHTGVTLQGKTVLIVEDDEKLREVAVMMLQELGCQTIEASNGQEALVRLEDAKDVELLFTDCVMPGKFTGYKLAAEIRKRRPELPVLFTSAYTQEYDENQPPNLYTGFLPKPYTDAQLATALARLLPNARDLKHVAPIDIRDSGNSTQTEL